MDMVIPDEGKIKLLNWAMCSDGTDYEDFVLELYSNNYTPDDDSEFTSFDSATFPGYASITLPRNQFGAPAIAAHIAYTQTLQVPAYTCTGGGGQLVYGWFLYGADSFKVIAAQRFDNARNMTNGAKESLDPYKIGLKTLD
jgi:hypothetical protein